MQLSEHCMVLHGKRFFRNGRLLKKNTTHSLNMEIAEECPVVLPSKAKVMMNGARKF